MVTVSVVDKNRYAEAVRVAKELAAAKSEAEIAKTARKALESQMFIWGSRAACEWLREVSGLATAVARQYEGKRWYLFVSETSVVNSLIPD